MPERLFWYRLRAPGEFPFVPSVVSLLCIIKVNFNAKETGRSVHLHPTRQDDQEMTVTFIRLRLELGVSGHSKKRIELQFVRIEPRLNDRVVSSSFLPSIVQSKLDKRTFWNLSNDTEKSSFILDIHACYLSVEGLCENNYIRCTMKDALYI